MDLGLSTRNAAVQHAMLPFLTFFEESGLFERENDPSLNNFALGNPQDMPLAGFVDAIHRSVEPCDKNWFAYTRSDPYAQEVVAGALAKELGLPFDPADIAMTNGAFGALAVALQVVLEPDDEVILNLPPWFFYEAMVAAAGGVSVKVSVDRASFDLDLDAIESSITPRTRAIIVNTPNNPTGRIYPPELLQRLAQLLTEASTRNGQPIWLISDEPYRRIRFDNVEFSSPLAWYPYSMLTYSYGKVLLIPGERIGYLALPPTLPLQDREQMRLAVMTAQVAGGFLFPNATLQRSIGDLEALSIDLDRLGRKRDRMVKALGAIGYDVAAPQGTFYLLARSPLPDDTQFMRTLLAHDIACLPGTAVEFPGFFRISLTASEEMIKRSLPGFEAAFEEAQS